MPRLPPNLVRQAKSENPLLPLLLRVCRDLSSARNELRWLHEHARDAAHTERYASRGPALPQRSSNGEAGQNDPPNVRRVKLDYTEIEYSHIPTKAISKHSVIGKYFGRRSFRKVYQGAVIRDHVAQSETGPSLVPTVRSPKDPTSDHIPAPSLTYQDQTTDTLKSKLRKEGFHHDKIRRVVAGDVMPDGEVHRVSTFNIRTWSRDGNREVKVHRKTGKVLPLSNPDGKAQVQKILAENVGKRSKGMPLQYILGNQPFGNLDILCEHRVMIPRADTEMYTDKVAKLLLSALTATGLSPTPPWQRRKKFRILDLCTGTGCIALRLHSLLKPVDANQPALPAALDIEILGVDSSRYAIDLSRKNLDHNISQKLLHSDALHTVSFQLLDVLGLSRKTYEGETSGLQVRPMLNAAAAGILVEDIDRFSPGESWDMVIANPPYVGPKDYEVGGKTGSSVRDYEPKEALVPVGEGRFRSAATLQADLFYLPLNRIARAVDAQLLVMEVGDSSQALRVGKQLVSAERQALNSGQYAKRLETWRDDETVRILPTSNLSLIDQEFDKGANPQIPDRAIVMWSGAMADWRRQTLPEKTSSLDSNPNHEEPTSFHVRKVFTDQKPTEITKAAISPIRKPLKVLQALTKARKALSAIKAVDNPSMMQRNTAIRRQKHAENVLLQWQEKVERGLAKKRSERPASANTDMAEKV